MRNSTGQAFNPDEIVPLLGSFMGQAGQAEDAEKWKSKVRLCSCRWKATAHNITIWQFLDTEGESLLHSGLKKKGVFIAIT